MAISLNLDTSGNVVNPQVNNSTGQFNVGLVNGKIVPNGLTTGLSSAPPSPLPSVKTSVPNVAITNSGTLGSTVPTTSGPLQNVSSTGYYTPITPAFPNKTNTTPTPVKGVTSTVTPQPQTTTPASQTYPSQSGPNIVTQNGVTFQQTVNGDWVPISGSANNALPQGTTSPIDNVSVNPSTQTDTGTLTSTPTTNSDIYAAINQNQSNFTSLMNQVAQAYNLTPDQIAATQKVNDLNNQMATEKLNTANTIGNAFATPGSNASVATAQENEANRQSYYRQASLALQQQAAVQTLQLANTTQQQKLQAAQFLFNANQQQLPNLINLYKSVAPENMGTQYNPVTGDVVGIFRNPLTGETSSQVVANVGPQKTFTSSGIETDPNTGQQYFYGVTAGGQLVTQPVGSSAPSSTGSLQSSVTQGPTGNGFAMGYDLGAGQVMGPWANASGSDKTNYNYANEIANIAQNIPTDTQGLQQYISSVAPNSPITAPMILASAQKYNVNPQVLSAIFQQESSFGTKGVATKTMNPGNVGNTNSGATSNKGTWQGGIDAAAQLLAKRYVGPQTGDIASQLPPPLQSALNTINGIPYFDGSKLADATQIKQAQYYQSITGIPYVTSDNASKLQHIDVTMQNLQQMQSDASKILSSGILGRLKGLTVNQVENATQSNPTIAAFKAYRDTAINAIQALAAGNGQGFRLNSSEIETASSNLPSITDNLETANTKMNLVMSFLQKWQSEILPNTSQTASSNNDPLGIFQ